MWIKESEVIKYNNNKYRVCKISNIKGPMLFIIDNDDFQKVSEYYGWYSKSNNYIGCKVFDTKILYLHNLIMNRLKFDGKGQKYSVDHINRIGTDNRKENLRIISQSSQNFNQKKKKRKKNILPKDCGIDEKNIPRNIWYIKPNGNHGERFCVEIKGIPPYNDKIIWKTTSSKNISLKAKLEQATKYIRMLREKYPILKLINIGMNYNNDIINSIKDYNNIIKKSKFDCKNNCLVQIPTISTILNSNYTNLTKYEIKLIDNIHLKDYNIIDINFDKDDDTDVDYSSKSYIKLCKFIFDNIALSDYVSHNTDQIEINIIKKLKKIYSLDFFDPEICDTPLISYLKNTHFPKINIIKELKTDMNLFACDDDCNEPLFVYLNNSIQYDINIVKMLISEEFLNFKNDANGSPLIKYLMYFDIISNDIVNLLLTKENAGEIDWFCAYALHYYCQKQNATLKIIEKIMAYSNIDMACECASDKNNMSPYNYYVKYHKKLDKKIVAILKDDYWDNKI